MSDLLAFIVDSRFRKAAWPMIIEIRVEMLHTELINGRGPFLGNMGIAEVVTHNGAIFSFHECIIIGMPRPGFGKFDQ